MAGADYGHLVLNAGVEVLPDPQWGFDDPVLKALVGNKAWGIYGIGRYGFFNPEAVNVLIEKGGVGVTELHREGKPTLWRVDNDGVIIAGVSGYHVGREFESAEKYYGVSGRQIKKANQKLLLELNTWLKTL